MANKKGRVARPLKIRLANRKLVAREKALG